MCQDACIRYPPCMEPPTDDEVEELLEALRQGLPLVQREKLQASYVEFEADEVRGAVTRRERLEELVKQARSLRLTPLH